MSLERFESEHRTPALDSKGQERQLVLLRWPYKLKDFEKELAELEVSYLCDGHLSRFRGGLRLEMTRPPDVESLRRLSSFDDVEISASGTAMHLRTYQSMLERSAILTRLSKNEHELDRNLPKLMDARLIRREKQYLLHELHPYKGRYYPQLVKPLLNLSAKPGELVLDPFCGCGTTMIEAYFSGVGAVGVDLNPIACFISKAKLDSLSIDANAVRKEADRLLVKSRKAITHFRHHRTLDAYLDRELAIGNIRLPEVPNMQMWFSKGVLEEISILKDEIQQVQDEKIKGFLLLALSSIVKRVSNWDPEQVRQGLLKKPRENVRVFEAFESQLRDCQLILFMLRAIRPMLPVNPAVKCDVYQHDSRHLEFLRDEDIDAIVTSPPYATALPYLDTDRLPMYVLGLLSPREMNALKDLMIGERDITPRNREQLEKEFLSNFDSLPLPLSVKEVISKILHQNSSANVGFRRKNMASTLYRYFMGMQGCIAEMARLLKPEGYCSMIVGDNRTLAGGKELVWIRTHELLSEMMTMAGFQLTRKIRMAPTSPYMIHVNNRIGDEYVLLFRKQC